MIKNLQKKNSPSLAERCRLTIILLTIIRIGEFIEIPYVNQELLANTTRNNFLQLNQVSDFLSSFSGRKTPSLNLFSLGIIPYINASILIQVLTIINPKLANLSKEEGEYGRRRIQQYTRVLACFFALIGGLGITYNVKSFIFQWNFLTVSQIVLFLMSGSMIMLWFSELITKDGLKNGSSILICFNIITNLPNQIIFLINSLYSPNLLRTLFNIVLLIVTYRFVILSCVFQNEGIIEIQLVSPKQSSKHFQNDDDEYIINQNKLPLRLNQAGVMPVVITSSIMSIFSSFLSNLKLQLIRSDFLVFNFLKPIFFYLPNFLNKILFWLTYGVLLVFFSKFYSKIVLSPKDISEQLRKSSYVIKDIEPGKDTQIYLKQTIEHLAKINALMFMSLVIPLEIIYKILNIPNFNSNGFSLTSQIILINVLIETIRVVKMYFLLEKDIGKKRKLISIKLKPFNQNRANRKLKSFNQDKPINQKNRAKLI